jgi:drug/metabolite transporter (DMT)-like permease
MAHLHSHSHLWPGVPLALGSAALFGATPPFSKLLLENLSPFMLAGLLYLGAGIGLAAYRVIRRAILGEEREAPLQRSDTPWLAAAVFMGGVIGPALLMFGLSRTSASSGALLLNLEGLATMAIAWLVFRENVDRRLLTGALAIMAGAALLAWDGQGARLDSGALMIAGACLAWGIDNNLTRKISAADPVVTAMIKGLAAGAVNVALALWVGASVPGAPLIAASAVLGFLGVGVSLVMFILALRHLGTARTGAYYSLAPFIGAVIAVLLLGEPVTANLLAAGALMGLGLWLHLSERHAHEHRHAALEHEHSHVHDAHHQHMHEGPVSEPHTHRHRHEPLSHAHPHFPDLHHRHGH